MQDDDRSPPPPTDPPHGSGGSWKYAAGIAAAVLIAVGVRGFRGDALDVGLAVVGLLGAIGMMALDKAIG